MTLQVAGFLEHSTVNGIGLRSVLFVSGCNHACPDCQNEAMQDQCYGESIAISTLYTRIMKNKPIIDGITFSGGEPFDQCNVLAKLAKLLKEEGLNIWCYTGYTYELLQASPKYHSLLELIDVLVDGPYIKALANPNLEYRGSSNQHIYALKYGKIVECLDDMFLL
ncbi:MAG: anaerobic ribonucleoside-triphosphate reductase activating protein [Cellulosilyticum sp.]|nr:anaerobic ribonucleoside-triphosphate reductase activating protein [Cellulosilyticum sp.]